MRLKTIILLICLLAFTGLPAEIGKKAGESATYPSDKTITGDLTVSGTVSYGTTAGITASTTQTQGQGALTKTVNQVATVANDNDTVTLPTASEGLHVTVINDGANDLQIFPATDDDLGLGADTATNIEPNDRILFVAYDATNWDIESTTLIAHAEMHDNDNTDAFGVSAANNIESYHSNGFITGDLLEWTFDAGGAGTSFPIASIADAGGGDITVTTTGSHTLAVGAIVSHANLADAAYEGVFSVLTVPTATTYTVTAVYTATGTGTMNEGATLTANALAVGDYILIWSLSATTATNNETFDFSLCVDVTADPGSTARNKFGTATDVQTVSGVGIITAVSGTKVSFGITNTNTAGDITIRNLVVAMHRL